MQNNDLTKQDSLRIKKYWKRYLIVFLILLVVQGGIVTLISLLMANNNYDILIGLETGFGISGFAVLFIGLLLWVNKCGFFDTISYGFISFGNMFRRNINNRKYKTYIEYRDNKIENRRAAPLYFLPTLAASVPFIITFFIIFIIRINNI